MSGVAVITGPDSAQVEVLADSAVERWGGIGAWVNNAGALLGAAPIADVGGEDWQRCQAINAGGCFHGCRAAVRRMQAVSEQRGGRIVNVSSQAGKTGPPHFAAYAAAKFAVIGLNQSIAAEVGRSGITVNAVCPGTVDTPLLDEPGGSGRRWRRRAESVSSAPPAQLRSGAWPSRARSRA